MTISNLLKNRNKDRLNGASAHTLAGYVAKDLFKEHMPYYKEFDETGEVPFITYHFLKEIRRQLSGESAYTVFSPEELSFYEAYVDYNDSINSSITIEQKALEVLDKWLVDEITGAPHLVIDRTFSPTHKWNKTKKRGY